MNKKILLLATDRYSININDFYMFYRRTGHEIVALLYHINCPEKQWWKKNAFADPARNKIYDKMNFEALNLISWCDIQSLLNAIEKIEFDYLCMGNGSGIEQQEVVKKVGIDKCLFSEYGWLPWSECFSISRKGTGFNSDISDFTQESLQSIKIHQSEIDKLKDHFRKGRFFFKKDFIYVPLQKDVNDFKFNFTSFSCNEDFLDFIHEVVPKEIQILVKEHPLYRRHYDYKTYGRFTDISDKNFSKARLYKRMLGMVCINSTSILEALLFGGRVFAYGKDIFLNKNLVHFQVDSSSDFEQRLNIPVREKTAMAFISLLLERQINRKQCLMNDKNYIYHHYWNKAI
jgi:hypothetical protein